MVFVSHCKCCGMKRTEKTTGSQKNPGECDKTEYSEPDGDWVEEHYPSDKTTYTLRGSSSGYCVVRSSDGALAEFLDSDEADEARKMLESGDSDEGDYEWAE